MNLQHSRHLVRRLFSFLRITPQRSPQREVLCDHTPLQKTPIVYATQENVQCVTRLCQSLSFPRNPSPHVGLLDLSGLVRLESLQDLPYTVSGVRADARDLHAMTLILQRHSAFSLLLLTLECTTQRPTYRRALAHLWASHSTLPATCPWVVLALGEPATRDPFIRTLRAHPRCSPWSNLP